MVEFRVQLEYHFHDPFCEMPKISEHQFYKWLKHVSLNVGSVMASGTGRETQVPVEEYIF